MPMYVWSLPSDFLAVAQAATVAKARARLLIELGESGDGSCPERDKAREYVLRSNPSVWLGENAEFALTTSAELREQVDYSEKLFAKCEKLRSIIEGKCLAIHIHDRTYAVRMWERWVIRELLAEPWGPSTGESYSLEEVLAKVEEVK